MGSADVPGILGSSAGFLRGTSGLSVMALEVALISPWQTLCVTNLRQMEPEHLVGHRWHPLIVKLGNLRQRSQTVPIFQLPLLSLSSGGRFQSTGVPWASLWIVRAQKGECRMMRFPVSVTMGSLAVDLCVCLSRTSAPRRVE